MVRNSQRVEKHKRRSKNASGHRTAVTPHCKIWMERNGRIALSDWRVELLELVGETGSLAAAAKRLHVPYRTAWYKLKELEECWGVPLLVTASGGVAGGGSWLTTEAQELISRFRRISADIHQIVEKRYREEFRDG